MKTNSYTVHELMQINSNIDNLIICPKLGVAKSLILHKNKQVIKPILKEIEEEFKILTKLTHELDEQGNYKYKGGQPIPIPEKQADYKNTYNQLMDKSFDVSFTKILLSELPESDKLGKANDVDFYQFVVLLFDIIFVETLEEITQ